MSRRGKTGESVKHGMTRGGKVSAEYRALSNIKTRCLNPKTKNFYRYGGRGIRVCDRWLIGDGTLNGYECFLADMGPRPSSAHSVERIDNDGDYSPENCRWATSKEQANNTRRNIALQVGGKEYTFAAACDEFGVSYNHLYKRVTRNGWTLQQVIQEAKENDRL